MYKQTSPNNLLNINETLEAVEIKHNQKIADLGCGSFGYFIFPAAKIVGSHGRAYAVDILKSNLEEVKKKSKTENLPQIQTIWSDLEIFKATRIENSSLDVALLINTLNQSKKRKEIIRESLRLLKKNGKLVIIEWKNIDLPFGPQTEQKVKKENLKQAAPNLGLKLEKEFSAGKYHYGLIFKKI